MPLATRANSATPSSVSFTTTSSPSGSLRQVERGEHPREHEHRVGAGRKNAAARPAVGVRGLAEVRDLALDAGQVLEVGRRRAGRAPPMPSASIRSATAGGAPRSRTQRRGYGLARARHPGPSRSRTRLGRTRSRVVTSSIRRDLESRGSADWTVSGHTFGERRRRAKQWPPVGFFPSCHVASGRLSCWMT